MGSILIVGSRSREGKGDSNSEDEAKGGLSIYLEGIFFVFVIVIISGYSAVFMEKLFKHSEDKECKGVVNDDSKDDSKDNDSDQEQLLMINEKSPSSPSLSMKMPAAGNSSSIWECNFQLAFFSMILMFFILIINGYNQQSESTLFSNWSAYPCILTILQGSGGLIAAASLKYTNANLKTLATTLSIVFSSILEFAFMGLNLTTSMIVGIVTVIAAVYSFTLH